MAPVTSSPLSGLQHNVLRRIVAAVTVSVLGSAFPIGAGAPAPEYLRAIDAMVGEHGTAPFVSMILANRRGRITVEVDGKQRTGYGPPNHRFITAATIANDLSSMGAGVEDLPELLAPYLQTTDSATNHGGFVVSDANLTSIAEHGTISAAGGATPAIAGTNGVPNSSTTGAISSDPGTTNADAKGTALERRIAVLWEDVESMKLSPSDPQLLSQKIQEIARLQDELEQAKREAINESVRASRLSAESDEVKRPYWVGKMKKAVDNVSRLKAEIDELNQQKDQLEKGLFSFIGNGSYVDEYGVRHELPRGYTERSIEEKLRAIEKRLSKARSEFGYAEHVLSELKNEARRDGAKPGWFRGIE